MDVMSVLNFPNEICVGSNSPIIDQVGLLSDNLFLASQFFVQVLLLLLSISYFRR